MCAEYRDEYGAWRKKSEKVKFAKLHSAAKVRPHAPLWGSKCLSFYSAMFVLFLARATSNYRPKDTGRKVQGGMCSFYFLNIRVQPPLLIKYPKNRIKSKPVDIKAPYTKRKKLPFLNTTIFVYMVRGRRSPLQHKEISYKTRTLCYGKIKFYTYMTCVEEIRTVNPRD